MSTPIYHHPPADWMHPHHAHPLFNSHTNGHPYSSAPSDQAYGYEQNYAFPPHYHQPYDDAGCGTHTVIQPTHSPQPDLRPHRRQNSTSTTGSYASFRSPYPHTNNQVVYPAGFDNSYVDQSYDPYNPNAHYQKHLPTPSRTPTQDPLMDGQRGYDRRSGGTVAGQKFQRQPHSDDAPATPRTTNGDPIGEEYNGNAHGARRVPAFDRTYSAVVQDELYDPIAVRQTQAPIPQAHTGKSSTMLSPYRNIVTDRLQAANDARSARSPVGRVSREASPFRQGSPFAGSNPTYAPIGSAAGQRQQQKAESDALAYQRHHQPPDDAQPKTISPKDAVLDYHDQSDDIPSGPALFPQSSTTSDNSNYDNASRAYGPLNGGRSQMQPQYQPPTSTFNFAAPSVPASAHTNSNNSDYKFAPHQYRTDNSEDSQEHPDYPAHLVSMDTSKSEQEGEEHSHESDVEKPAGTTADSGTYTCTYHGCSQRFSTPALLQKHKREGHRASVSDASQQQPSSPGGSSTPRNSQAGPHRCDRINPSTGKPCSTVFSRPYDLTRHEDTIHAQKIKVRCQYCTEEKTFSRNDALTRHMRVVHPNIDFPGKHRRRHVE